MVQPAIRGGSNVIAANTAVSLEKTMNSRALDAEQTTLKMHVFNDLLYSESHTRVH